MSSWQEVHKQVCISQVLYSQAGVHDKICQVFPWKISLFRKNWRYGFGTSSQKTCWQRKMSWKLCLCAVSLELWCVVAESSLTQQLAQNVRSTWGCVERDQYNSENTTKNCSKPALKTHQQQVIPFHYTLKDECSRSRLRKEQMTILSLWTCIVKCLKYNLLFRVRKT